MLIRAIGTGFGGEWHGLAESVAYEIERASRDSVSVAFFNGKKRASNMWVGSASFALVVDERECVVQRRWRDDAATSPSPIGRISEQKPNWCPNRQSYGYAEWAVIPMRYRAWLFTGYGYSRSQREEIERIMQQTGLPQIKRRPGHQRH